jgi:hypothetical protein
MCEVEKYLGNWGNCSCDSNQQYNIPAFSAAQLRETGRIAGGHPVPKSSDFSEEPNPRA